MKLNELKCKNCGATLKVEGNVDTVTCKYCQTTFSVEDSYNEAYKRTKGMMDATVEGFENQVKMLNNLVNRDPMFKFARITFIVILNKIEVITTYGKLLYEAINEKVVIKKLETDILTIFLRILNT